MLQVSRKEFFLIQLLEKLKMEFTIHNMEYSFLIGNKKFIRKQMNSIREVNDTSVIYILENDDLYKIQEYNTKVILFQQFIQKLETIQIIRSNDINETVLIIRGLMN
tara:strand:- start:458 stop:778 length:321 start_codon:yes stop_codon:yes gene_type:complete